MAKSDDNNAMECRVGLAVAASVEPMPVGLAGGSRDGIDTAQGGEGSLGVEAVRVTPCSNEEGRLSIARVYGPVVARVIEPTLWAVRWTIITVRFEGQPPPFDRAAPCVVTSARGSCLLL